MDMIGLNGLALLRLAHRHLGATAEELGQVAHVRRVQMHDDDEAQAPIRRHCPDEPFQGVESSSRGADRDHRKLR
jgi:hypothetical protein